MPPICPPPLIIEPLGAVPKSSAPFFRLISDARKSNKSIADWHTKCYTLRAAISPLNYAAYLASEDGDDAYHSVPLAGCTGRLIEAQELVLQADGRATLQTRLYLGCSPRTCLGTCDKARAGVCIDGLLCRFSCAHFGQKLAGVPLNCILNQFACHCVRRVMSRGLPRLSELSLPHDVPTSSGEPSRCAEQVGDAACPVALVEDADSPIVPCTYGAPGSVPPGCALGPLMVSLWVDDLLTAQNIYYHGRCGGLVGGCPICATLLSHFTESQHYMRNLAAQLGFSLHAKKRQEPSQRATYTGIIIDTVAFRLFIPDDKLAKLRSSLLELISAESCSFRSLAAVRGRLLHYSVCILHIRPLVPAISDGPESEASYDSPRPVRDHLRKAADRLLDVIGR